MSIHVKSKSPENTQFDFTNSNESRQMVPVLTMKKVVSNPLGQSNNMITEDEPWATSRHSESEAPIANSDFKLS